MNRWKPEERNDPKGEQMNTERLLFTALVGTTLIILVCIGSNVFVRYHLVKSGYWRPFHTFDREGRGSSESSVQPGTVVKYDRVRPFNLPRRWRKLV